MREDQLATRDEDYMALQTKFAELQAQLQANIQASVAEQQLPPPSSPPPSSLMTNDSVANQQVTDMPPPPSPTSMQPTAQPTVHVTKPYVKIREYDGKSSALQWWLRFMTFVQYMA